MNATHDPALRSWVESANRRGCGFSDSESAVRVFRRAGAAASAQAQSRFAVAWPSATRCSIWARRVARPVASGGRVTEALVACGEPTLNSFWLSGARPGRHCAHFCRKCCAPTHRMRRGCVRRSCRRAMPNSRVPASIGDYTDFYASIHHATSVGRLFRPDNPLLPNYKWVPIGYHGRGVVDPGFGTGVCAAGGADHAERRAQSVRGADPQSRLRVGSRDLHRHGQCLGSRVALDAAEDHVFGLCLLNDWSARDIQAWEYQPLGPFLAKNFATTISPWIVTLEALAPFRAPWTRPAEDPQPLPYLEGAGVAGRGSIDMRLEVWLETERMRAEGAGAGAPVPFDFSGFLLERRAVGCAPHRQWMQPRGGRSAGQRHAIRPTAEEAGSLLELSEGGKRPMTLRSGETRTFWRMGIELLSAAGASARDSRGLGSARSRAWCCRPTSTRLEVASRS